MIAALGSCIAQADKKFVGLQGRSLDVIKTVVSVPQPSAG